MSRKKNLNLENAFRTWAAERNRSSSNYWVCWQKERTGHPSQKPEIVFDKLLLMANQKGDIVFDPMAGSGTTAACAKKHGMKSIVCDMNEDYIQMIEKRMGVSRIEL